MHLKRSIDAFVSLHQDVIKDIKKKKNLFSCLSDPQINQGIGRSGKKGELGNLIPMKFLHLEGNLASQNKEIHTKWWEI